MDKRKFSFELIDKYTPDTVMRNMLKQIEEATNGYVAGHIEEYDGPIVSYTGNAVMLNEATAKIFQNDIQDTLGEQNQEHHRYEVYITVEGLEYYKYRMMYVDYGRIAYPVTIIMNEELAIAYSRRRNDRFRIDSMKELEEMMNVIMDSDIMVTLVQSLINESLRQEMKAANMLEEA